MDIVSAVVDKHSRDVLISMAAKEGLLETRE
jgi:hypothetical protein